MSEYLFVRLLFTPCLLFDGCQTEQQVRGNHPISTQTAIKKKLTCSVKKVYKLCQDFIALVDIIKENFHPSLPDQVIGLRIGTEAKSPPQLAFTGLSKKIKR